MFIGNQYYLKFLLHLYFTNSNRYKKIQFVRTILGEVSAQEKKENYKTIKMCNHP